MSLISLNKLPLQDGSHANSDDEMLKRKVQSIVDCFLDSVYSPTLQVTPRAIDPQYLYVVKYKKKNTVSSSTQTVSHTHDEKVIKCNDTIPNCEAG